MTRPETRYSNASTTPSRYSLLETPTNNTSAVQKQLQRESLVSTLTLSPLAGDTARPRLFENSPVASPVSDTTEQSSEQKQIHRLRLWRHDALLQHQYVTAAFIGDKIFSRTNDANDAFWLAQCYFGSGHFARAYDLLLKRELVDTSIFCRCLAAQSLVKMDKWTEALELLGEVNPFKEARRPEDGDGGIKMEASMCHLRGRVFSQLNNFDRAKECYVEALTLDVKCFDALDDLLSNNLMTSEEEWNFLDTLPFQGLHADDVEFVRMVYTTKLNKYRYSDRFLKAENILQVKYNLAENTDMIQTRAELLFSQCRFDECLQLTSKILKLDRYKLNTFPLHLTCLHELGRKNDLFLLSHDMADRHPEEPVTWLAIGTYYMSISKVAEARRHFSKASVMNPRFGPAWIGFAHSFAIEGEHDQAISAYTTASRLFQGTHLPSLFLGMQNLQLNNIILADEYLNTSYSMCKTDPLLLNELGVVCFHKLHLQSAINWFTKALEVADATDSRPTAWVATHANLGHAYRKLGMLDKALGHFEEVKRLAPLDSGPYAASGLIYMQQDRFEDAIESLHRALALNAADSLSADLLSKALMEAANQPGEFPGDDANFSIDDLLLRIDVENPANSPSEMVTDEESMEYD